MAKILQMPRQEIIDGFKGVLDFYRWKGIVCVRSWPRKPKMPRSIPVQATAQLFGDLATAFTDTPPNIRARATEMASGTKWTWRDVRYRAAYGNLVHDLYST